MNPTTALIVATVTCVLAVLAYAGRYYIIHHVEEVGSPEPGTKRTPAHAMRKTNVFLGIALGLLILLVIMMFFEVKHGSGKHMSDTTYEEVEKSMMFTFTSIPFYYIAITCSKYGIVYLYRYALWSVEHVQMGTNVILVVLFCMTEVWVLMSILICAPVERFYELLLSEHCMNTAVVNIASLGYNFVTDIFIFGLPLWTYIHLNASQVRRRALLTMWSFLLIAAATTLIRMAFVTALQKNVDPSYDGLWLIFWMRIEIATYIICACLPTFGPPLARRFPRLFARNPANQPRTRTSITLEDLTRAGLAAPNPARSRQGRGRARAGRR